MKTIIWGRCLAILILSAALSACATAGDPSVRLARDKFQTRRTYAQGIGGGAVIGAVAGALVGSLHAAATHGNVAREALIGAGVGTIAGVGVGAGVAERQIAQRREYLARQNRLDNAIKNAHSTRLAAKEFNRTLASRVRAARRDASIRAGTLDDARAVQDSLQREISRQQQTLANASSTQMSAGERNDLQTEVRGLINEQRQLESNIEQLAPPSVGRLSSNP